MSNFKENIIYEPFNTLEEQDIAETLLKDEVEGLAEIGNEGDIEEGLKESIKENSETIEKQVENILKNLR